MLGPRLPWDWHDGVVPDSAVLDDESYVETSYSFLLDRSEAPYGVRVGRGTSAYSGTMFDVAECGTVSFGRFCMTNGARFVCDREITVGDYTLIGWNTVVMDTRRTPIDPEQRRAALTAQPPSVSAALPHLGAGAEPRPVHIGSAVWIGFECVIMPGVSIGDGVVVGARSVVTEDIEAWTVVAGNPARVVRRLDRLDPIPEPPVWSRPP